MKRSAWVITGAAVLLALVAVWFFGLGAPHAVVLVGAAVAAGVANGLLESVDLRRPVLAAVPAPTHGLADVQALEFSLTSGEPGARALLELHTVGRLLVAARPDAELSDPLVSFLAAARPPTLTHRELEGFLRELSAAGPGDEQVDRP